MSAPVINEASLFLLLKKFKEQRKSQSKLADQVDVLALELASQKNKIDAALQQIKNNVDDGSISAGALISQPPAAVVGRKASARYDWLQGGKDCTGRRCGLGSSLIDSTTVKSLIKKFEVAVPNHSSFISTSPVVDRSTDRVYFVTMRGALKDSTGKAIGYIPANSRLYCMDFHTGEIYWYKTGAEITGITAAVSGYSDDYIRNSPAILGDYIYVCNNMPHFCMLVKMHKATGEVVWRKNLNPTSPNAQLGTNIMALDLNQIPQYKGKTLDNPRLVFVGETSLQSYAPADDPIKNVEGKCTDKGTIYCVNADTGALVWKFVVSPDDYKEGDKIGLEAFNKTVTMVGSNKVYGYEEKMLIRVRLSAGMQVISPDSAAPKTKNQVRISGTFKIVRPLYIDAAKTDLKPDNQQTDNKMQDFTSITTITAGSAATDLDGYYAYCYLRPGDELSASEAYYCNFYGPSTWGQGPMFDAERGQVVFSTGESHMAPMNYNIFLNWYNPDGTSKDPVAYVNSPSYMREPPITTAYKALVNAKAAYASAPSSATLSQLESAEAAFKTASNVLRERFELCSDRAKRHLNNSAVSVDLLTGRLNWSSKVTIWDVWNYAELNAYGKSVLNTDITPTNLRQDIWGINWGDDADLSHTPQLIESPDGDHTKDVFCMASKGGAIWSVNAKTGVKKEFIQAGPPGLLGGNNYSACTDGRYLYVNQINQPLSMTNQLKFFDSLRTYEPNGEIYSIYTGMNGKLYNNVAISKLSNGRRFIANTNDVEAQVLDHLEFLHITKNAFAVPQDGVLSLGATLSVKVDYNPERLVQNYNYNLTGEKYNLDPRLGAGALSCGDYSTFTASYFSTFLVFDIFVTNGMVYALYERLPFGRSANNNYAAFTYTIPIARVTPGQKVNVHFNYDHKFDKVSFYVDSARKLTINEVGKRLTSTNVTDMTDAEAVSLGLTNVTSIHTECHVNDLGGETANPVKIGYMSTGIGIFTLMDFLPPANIASVQSNPQQGLTKLEDGHVIPTNRTQDLTYVLTSPTDEQRRNGSVVTMDVHNLYAAAYSDLYYGYPNQATAQIRTNGSQHVGLFEVWLTPKGNIVPFGRSFFVAYDPFHEPSENAIKWEYIYSTNKDLSMATTASVSKDLVIVGAADGNLRFLKAEDGSLVKTVKLDFMSGNPVAISEDSFFLQGGYTVSGLFKGLPAIDTESSHLMAFSLGN